jgi:nucleotide-binding universal stress UspA family protein
VSGIVLGYDHSPAAQAAMRWAAEQAQRCGTEVRVVYVVSSVSEWELAAIQVDPDPIRHEIERRLRDEWCLPLEERGVPFISCVKIGRVGDALMHAAQEMTADLIVVGMTQHGSLTQIVGSSAMRALRGHAVRPVVAVPAEWVGTP